MGVLGIIIQTEFGLPLYHEMFDPTLAKFEQIDTSLTSGFITAINMFTKQYEMTFGHIKLHQDAKDIYGVNMIATKMGQFLILCFVEPYIYHDVVREKIGWIYDRILKHYEPDIQAGKVPALTDEEKVWIADTLQDLYLKAMIAANKETISNLLGKLFMRYVGVYGFSINSFDNSILYFSGIAEETFKLLLNNLGRRSAVISEFEAVDSYISVPDYQAMRVYAVNSGVKFEIQDIMTNLPEKTVSFYYYIIVDPSLDVWPVINEVFEILNPFFARSNNKESRNE